MGFGATGHRPGKSVHRTDLSVERREHKRAAEPPAKLTRKRMRKDGTERREATPHKRLGKLD
jgi:hypothetical protein